MAGTLKISSRMMLAVLLIHAVLLPALYYALSAMIRSDHEGVFVDHVRAYSRSFADVLEGVTVDVSDTELQSYLDSMLLGGRSVYSSLERGDVRFLSTLLTKEDVQRFREDFRFGEHGDNVYFLSVPVQMSAGDAILKLGFDEAPTLQQIESAQKTILLILGAYLLASILFMMLLSGVLSRPLRRLQKDSRIVASGDYSHQLSADSRIEEIRDLAADLEAMRSRLVGVSARLQQEMAEKEVVEAERRRMETRLQHMQRLDSIGTLAGGIAHEFNNILQPMLLYTDLALEDLPEGAPSRTKLKRIVALAHRARALCRKILTFGRPASDSDMFWLELGPVVAEAMTMVRAMIPVNVDIRIGIGMDVGLVRVDPDEIQQLVVNLCSNAYLALPAEGGCLSVDVAAATVDAQMAHSHPRLEAGRYARLSVSDTGVGMDAETAAKIFEPFFTTREVGKGSGLGLSVVHGIVVRHKGDIVVRSELGRGTRFDVYIPLANANAAT